MVAGSFNSSHHHSLSSSELSVFDRRTTRKTTKETGGVVSKVTSGWVHKKQQRGGSGSNLRSGERSGSGGGEVVSVAASSRRSGGDKSFERVLSPNRRAALSHKRRVELKEREERTAAAKRAAQEKVNRRRSGGKSKDFQPVEQQQEQSVKPKQVRRQSPKRSISVGSTRAVHLSRNRDHRPTNFDRFHRLEMMPKKLEDDSTIITLSTDGSIEIAVTPAPVSALSSRSGNSKRRGSDGRIHQPDGRKMDSSTLNSSSSFRREQPSPRSKPRDKFGARRDAISSSKIPSPAPDSAVVPPPSSKLTHGPPPSPDRRRKMAMDQRPAAGADVGWSDGSFAVPSWVPIDWGNIVAHGDSAAVTLHTALAMLASVAGSTDEEKSAILSDFWDEEVDRYACESVGKEDDDDENIVVTCSTETRPARGGARHRRSAGRCR